MNGSDRDGGRRQRITGVYDMLFGERTIWITSENYTNIRLGDKETFWIGWELAGDVDYTFHSGLAGVMGTLRLEPEQVKGNAAKKITTTGLAPHVHTHDSKVTICAPQLLHMDYDGFATLVQWVDHRKTSLTRSIPSCRSSNGTCEKPAKLTHPEAWDLGKDNLCCLSGLETFEFTTNETQVLNTIVRIASGSWGGIPGHRDHRKPGECHNSGRSSFGPALCGI